MKPPATPCNSSEAISSPRRFKYTKVLDNRKHGIRGLWRRLDRYYARITIENDSGRKAVKWMPPNARTAAEVRQELDAVKLARKEHRLRHIGRCPTFAITCGFCRCVEPASRKPSSCGGLNERSKTFRESLLLTRAVSGWVCRDCQGIVASCSGWTRRLPARNAGGTGLDAKEQALPENLQRMGFHDLRHHFLFPVEML
ncbi:MAG TPA: hypothetical protein P5555_03690 [Candidatus Paceibacterota bacterium]|nr:hypothetical protein [Verrucomicrobiota bacterium]HRZ44274.1 hypothetical protein [Candidatus Paceibacterota bacterium]